MIRPLMNTKYQIQQANKIKQQEERDREEFLKAVNALRPQDIYRARRQKRDY